MTFGARARSHSLSLSLLERACEHAICVIGRFFVVIGIQIVDRRPAASGVGWVAGARPVGGRVCQILIFSITYKTCTNSYLGYLLELERGR